MREYIFTEKERLELKNYLENRVRSEGFYSLENRIRKNLVVLEKDWQLLCKWLEVKNQQKKESRKLQVDINKRMRSKSKGRENS